MHDADLWPPYALSYTCTQQTHSKLKSKLKLIGYRKRSLSLQIQIVINIDSNVDS